MSVHHFAQSLRVAYYEIFLLRMLMSLIVLRVPIRVIDNSSTMLDPGS